VREVREEGHSRRGRKRGRKRERERVEKK